ncbi:DUF2786 domain-containing protein [Rhodococcus sp. IEGM1300]
MSAQQIDEKKLERAIRKIKHCLALAQSSNENEAATALRQAQALMREYRLTEMDVKLSDVGEVESSMSRATRRPVWDRTLSAAVAKAFGCKTLRHTHWCKIKERRVERAAFVGVAPAHHIALYAYETLLAKLTQARKKYVAGVRAGRFRSNYSPDTAGDHFAVAWASEVWRKLEELVPKGETDQALPLHSNGTDLVTVAAQDKALIEHYLSDKQIGKARKQSPLDLDLNAQIAGMLAGQNVDLHAGLARAGDDLLALSA